MPARREREIDFLSELSLDRSSPERLHPRLAEALRGRLTRERTKPGTALPSERKVAERLGIHRDTIHRAYDTLIADGFLTRPPGRRNVFVADRADEKYRPSFPSIGIVMPRGFAHYVGVSSRLNLGYLSGLIERATEREHSTIILTLPPPDESPERVKIWLDGFIDRTIAILHFGARELMVDAPLEALLEDTRTPQIFVSGYSELAHISSIRGDVRPGADAAAKLLHDLGHRRVGIFRPTWLPEESRHFKHYSELRADIILESFTAAGFDIRPEWTARFRGNETKQISTAIDRMFSLKETPTALWCQNDETAFSVLEELRAKNIRVPEDVSLIGFDDIESERPGKPFLTTIAQPRYDIGKQAIDLAIELYEAGVSGMSRRLQLSTTLVVRDSTATAKPRGKQK